ncbi:hypothetical protein ACFOM8_03265 [Paracoccus angustae]|uniref:DUF3489 domain-containing protein n=1 Tax=Paracoccus angustae TaxID=1671480 RepID=A0ABV7U0U8_9RHOB
MKQRQSSKPGSPEAALDDLAAMGLPRTAEDAVATPQDISAALSALPDPTAQVPDPEGGADALRVLIQHLRAVPVASPAPARRRILASPKRITETLRIVQACGLTPSGVVHRPDGSTVIEIGAAAQPEPRKPRGWKIMGR